jgi:beta-carotene hydroxylase
VTPVEAPRAGLVVGVPARRDPRIAFAALLTSFAVLGTAWLGFNRSPAQIAFTVLSACTLDVLLHYLLRERRILFPLSAYISALSIALLLDYSHDWLPVLFPVFVAIGSKYLLTLGGRHMHAPTFRLPALNALFQIALGVATGTSATGIITVHNLRHHGESQSDRDFVRASLVRFRSNVLNVLLFPFVSIFTIWRCKPNDLLRWRRGRPALFRQALLERAVIALVLGGALLADFRGAVWVLLAPWAFAQWALIAVNHLQHQGLDPDSDVRHSRDITGPVANWLLLNNGFHTAHHERPALHWSQLPALHAELAPRMDPSLCHASFGGAVLAHLRRSP